MIQLEEGKTFKDHTTYVHDFWSYCNYLIYLSQKEIEDMNGLEGHIREKIDEISNAWIPSTNAELEEEASQKKAEELEKERTSKIDAIKSSSEEAQKSIKALEEKLTKIQEEVTKIATATGEASKSEQENIKQKRA